MEKRCFRINATPKETKGWYPITDSGNMLEWIYSGATDAVYWKEMKPFFATLAYKGFQQGRSSVRFILQDVQTGVTYYLMQNSFDTFITKARNGILGAGYVVVKRGAYYGLLLTEDL